MVKISLFDYWHELKNKKNNAAFVGSVHALCQSAGLNHDFR